MKVIRFELEGLLNSYRVPFFRTYHKSFLAPPKTTIIGMLCNISLKSQNIFFDILNRNEIKVSVVINDIRGQTKDLWSYKTLKKVNMGKSIIRRDRLFRAYYTIYLNIENKKLHEEILVNLKNPKNIPSLGLDDELVHIRNVKEITLCDDSSNKIDSIFLSKKHQRYKIFVKDIDRKVELPTSNLVSTKYKAYDDKGERISKESIKSYEYNQVEFINCQIEFENEVESFIDNELQNKLLFY